MSLYDVMPLEVPTDGLMMKAVARLRSQLSCPMTNAVMASAAAVYAFCRRRRGLAGLNYACQDCKEYANIAQGKLPAFVKIQEGLIMPSKKTSKKIGVCASCGEEREIKAYGMCQRCADRHYRARKRAEKAQAAKEQEANIPNQEETMQDMQEIQQAMQQESQGDQVPQEQPCYSTNPAFDGLLRRMGAIHDAKRRDYASNDNPLGNFDAVGILGISPQLGILVRMTDKFTRACNLVRRRGECYVQDESLEDTLIDLANYALLAILAGRQ